MAELEQSSSVVNENSKIPFGRMYKGRRLRNCPDSYVKWIASHLWDTDLHEFAYAAKQVMERREKDDLPCHDLEQAADEFLREHGLDVFGAKLKVPKKK